MKNLVLKRTVTFPELELGGIKTTPIPELQYIFQNPPQRRTLRVEGEWVRLVFPWHLITVNLQLIADKITFSYIYVLGLKGPQDWSGFFRGRETTPFILASTPQGELPYIDTVVLPLPNQVGFGLICLGRLGSRISSDDPDVLVHNVLNHLWQSKWTHSVVLTQWHEWRSVRSFEKFDPEKYVGLKLTFSA